MYIALSAQSGFNCDPSETLLEAAQKAGFNMPKACLNGVCHICEARLSRGSVLQKGLILHAPKMNENDASTLTETSEQGDAQGHTKILVCSAYPQSDCELDMDHVYGKGEAPVNTVVCEIGNIELIPPYVYRIRLMLPAGKLPVFYAGQYLSMQLPGKESPSYYSIASAPGLRELELHIQAAPDSDSANAVIDYLKNNPSVEVSLPFGKACLPEVPSVPVVMLAAGTGFAQMKSIAEFVLRENPEAHVHLFWGVRREEEMYLSELPEAWAQQYINVKFLPLIAGAEELDSSEHHDHLCQALIDAEPDIERDLVFVSGSPRLVFAALDLLKKAGLPEDQFFSDVLEYAKPE